MLGSPGRGVMWREGAWQPSGSVLVLLPLARTLVALGSRPRSPISWQVEQSHSPCGQDKREEEGRGQAPGARIPPAGPHFSPVPPPPKASLGTLPIHTKPTTMTK